jgi:3-phosphoshikimate 1-carboxyvinyltransferase
MALPDLIEIVPLDKPVRAEITVPGSKSITNRALILAALAEGDVTLEGSLWSEDTQIMVEALQKLGFQIQVDPDPEELCNRTITVKGLGGKIPNSGTAEKPLELFVGNAGTAARFLAAFVCLGSGVYRQHGTPRMHERPQAALFQALRELGCRVDSENGNEKLPARIYGSSPSPRPLPEGEGGRRPGEGKKKRICTVSIAESSQFASALLLCAKHGGWDVKVVGENAEESPYVAMTTKMVEAFPHQGGSIQIEPDASSGSYFIAAMSLEKSAERTSRTENECGGFAESFTIKPNVTVKYWPHSGWQMDEHFVLRYTTIAMHMGWNPFGQEEMQALEKKADALMGPNWRASVDNLQREQLQKVGPITMSRLTDLGDSIMTAIVMAPLATYLTKFVDLGRLRVQECERVVALRTELTRCGAKVVEEGDTLTVYPSQLHGAEIETYNDHRMAMCFAILGLKVPGIKIKNPACVKKTFPNFFQKLASPPPKGLGATMLDAKTGRKLEVEELFAE